jgi:hypothetical protein
MRFLLEYAVLAPSSHNSQPWDFSVQGDEVTVYVDDSRWLKVADADQREMYISTGCALENLLIAAEHFQQGYTVEYFPQGVEGAVATVTMIPGAEVEYPRDRDIFDMIRYRATNHNLFDDKKISKGDMTRLHDCCHEEGFCLYSTSEADNEAELRQVVDNLVRQADAIQLADPSYKKELASCIGKGDLGAPWLTAKVTQLAVTHLDISKGQTEKDSKILLSAPELFILGSSVDDRISQVIAGQIYERIALTAALLGLAVHPMSQILEIPEIKAELPSLLPGNDIVPQHAFRLGYAEPEKPHTPRNFPRL